MERNFLLNLHDIDVKHDEEMQQKMDMPPSEELMGKLRPIFDSVGSGQYSDMVEAVVTAYRSMLGYYKGKMTLLRLRGNDDMINLCNAFALVRDTMVEI